jgi:hypothetical protein
MLLTNRLVLIGSCHWMRASVKVNSMSLIRVVAREWKKNPASYLKFDRPKKIISVPKSLSFFFLLSMPPQPANNPPGMLAVNYTEDSNANQPITCGRQKAANCSKLIQPEEEHHYILDKNDLTGKGIIICSPCYVYYETKRGTLRATCKLRVQSALVYFC